MGQKMDSDVNSPKYLFGESNEADVILNGFRCTALLDTGSTVSTISQQYYEEHFADLDVNPLQQLLSIECANGATLPYSGYIEADLQMVGLTAVGVMPVLLLVVPNSKYNCKVPILIGTNVLCPLMEHCKTAHGERFSQMIVLPTAIDLSFRCITRRDKDLTKARGRVAFVQSGSHKKVSIPPNSTVTIQGRLSKCLDVTSCPVIVHSTEKTCLPDGVELSPYLFTYSGSMDSINLELSNHSNRIVIIPSRSRICELQQVDVQDSEVAVCNAMKDGEMSPVDDVKSHFLEQFPLQECAVEDDEREHIADLLWKYHHIFSTDELDIGRTSLVNHRIELKNDIPFKQRHRRIPPAMFEEVRDHLELMLQGNIIRESASPWASPVVLVRKKNGKLRFCIDYRQLNERTVRDSFALPRIEESLDFLSGSRYFSCLDL